jgi:hypothetical protein
MSLLKVGRKEGEEGMDENRSPVMDQLVVD